MPTGAAPKWFSKIESVPPEAPNTIVFVRALPAEPMTETAAALYSSIREAEHKISALFEGLSEQHSLIRQLEGAARDGLEGVHPDVDNGLAEFNAFKRSFNANALQAKAARIRSHLRIAIWPCVIGFLTVIAWSLLLYLIHSAPKNISYLISLFGTIGFCCLGVALGHLFVLLLAVRSVTYETADTLYRLQRSPAHDMLYIFVITAITIVLLAFNAVQLGVAQTLLNDFPRAPWLGILIGLLCTIAEQGIATLIISTVQPTRRSPSPE